MKKLTAMILALALLLPAGAWACEDPAVLVAKCGGSVVYEGASNWALTDDHSLAGIKDYGQIVEHIAVTSTRCQWVAGWMENGWARTWRSPPTAFRPVCSGGMGTMRRKYSSRPIPTVL